MKLLLPFAAIMVLFSSCATLLNGRYTVVQVHTKPENVITIINKKDTVFGSDKPIVVKRSDEFIEMDFKKDSLKKTIFLKSKLSTAYWLGNFWSPYFSGYLIDLTTPKRFTYPKEIFVNLNDSLRYFKYKTFVVNPNQRFNLGVSVPLANFYRFKTGNTYNDAGGMFGIAVNADLYLNKTLYLSTQTSWLGHSSWHPFYFHITLHDSVTTESRKIFFTNLMLNKVYDKWHIGMGISYQQFYWKKFIYDSLNINHIMQRSDSRGFGLSFALEYNFARNFFVGALYQPMLYNLDGGLFDYQHYWNIQFTYKYPLFKRKKSN
jgi:hypothetical protein